MAKAKLTLREGSHLILEVHEKGHVSLQEFDGDRPLQPTVMNAKKAYAIGLWLTKHASEVDGDKATYDPAEVTRKIREAVRQNPKQHSSRVDKRYFRGSNEEETRVLEALTPTPRPTRDIAEESGVSKIAANAILKRFYEAGKIERGEEELKRPYMGHTHRAVWSLKEED